MKKTMVAAFGVFLVSGTMAYVAIAQDGERPHERGERGAKMLERVDTNGDGNISLEEVEAAKAEKFSSTDLNGDGAITLEEMTASKEARQAERKAARTERAFARLDENGDGSITVAEFEAHDAKRQMNWFEKADTDGDGLVTEAEREAAWAARKGKRRNGQQGGNH
ncbi:MAG: hypothetical protein Hens3KO_04360 [Henriciella sp.]